VIRFTPQPLFPWNNGLYYPLGRSLVISIGRDVIRKSFIYRASVTDDDDDYGGGGGGGKNVLTQTPFWERTGSDFF
jgi:hypothetical protein